MTSGGWGRCTGFGVLQVGDGVVLAGERVRSSVKIVLRRYGLRQPGDPQAGRLEGDAGLVVLLLEPASADAEFEAAVGEDSIVAAALAVRAGWRKSLSKTNGADAHLGDHGGGRQRGDGIEAADEVVRPADRVIAECFDPSHRLQPRLARPGAAALHSESEREKACDPASIPPFPRY